MPLAHCRTALDVFSRHSLRGRFLFLTLGSVLVVSLSTAFMVEWFALGHESTASVLGQALIAGLVALLFFGIPALFLADSLARPICALAAFLREIEKNGDLELRPQSPGAGVPREIRSIHEAVDGFMLTLAHQKKQEHLALEALDQEKKRLLSLSRVHQVLMRAVDEHALVSTTDKQGRITFINERFFQVSQYCLEDLLGEKHSQTRSGLHDRAFYAEIWSRLGAGFTWRGEICNRRKDGRLYWVDAAIVPALDEGGEINGYTAVSLDITARKENELELYRHRDNLQRLVEERTAGLLLAKEGAERANLAKSDFLANITHELRTPLHAIISFTRLVQHRLKSGKMETAEEYLGDIYSASQRLLFLVNDLLDLSKFEAGKLGIAPGLNDLRPTLEASLRGVEPLLAAKSLIFELHVETASTLVWADPPRLQQVLANLLANAIKFSPQGGKITLTLADAVLPLGRRQTDPTTLPALSIELRDAGVGIPEDELEGIFEKFVQSRTTRNGAGGTGLGLAIAREIVQAHHGLIEARNNLDCGSTFSVRLPREAPATG